MKIEQLVKELENDLEHILEYWNGNANERAMQDALEEILATAEKMEAKLRAALASADGPKLDGLAPAEPPHIHFNADEVGGDPAIYKRAPAERTDPTFLSWWDEQIGHIPNDLCTALPNFKHWAKKAFDAGASRRAAPLTEEQVRQAASFVVLRLPGKLHLDTSDRNEAGRVIHDLLRRALLSSPTEAPPFLYVNEDKIEHICPDCEKAYTGRYHECAPEIPLPSIESTSVTVKTAEPPTVPQPSSRFFDGNGNEEFPAPPAPGTSGETK